MEGLLTSGGVKKMFDEVPITPSFQPVVQVLALKEVTKGEVTRYRVYVSDGVHSTSSAMLAAHHSGMVQSGAISTNCALKVTNYSLSQPSVDRKVLLISALTVMKTGEEIGCKLGNPATYKPGEQQQQQSNGTDTSTAAVANGNKPQTNGAQTFTRKPPTSAGTPGGTGRIYPIASLTPYQNRWTIKGRVTQKSGVRTYSNSRGEGKFFNCIFSDESGEIKATAWKSECDAFFDLIELNKVYMVSKGQLKTANKQFSNTNNDYEMNMSAETSITACDESEAASVPTIQYKFVNIADLASKPVGNIVDVCGVVHTVGDCNTIIAKASQRELTKREVELVDDTNMSVRLTLWGDEASKFPADVGPVMAVKSCKIGDWNGRSLGTISSSQIIIAPDCAEGHRLRGWYDTHGNSTQFKSYAGDGGSMGSGSQTKSWKWFDCIQAEKIGLGEKPDYYMVKAQTAYIKKENCMYMACSSEGCNKKVMDNGDGSYRCEKCNKTMPDFKYRLLLQMHLADVTGFHWVTAFQDSAEKLLGKTAKEMGEMRDNEDLFDLTLKQALMQPYQFTLRSKMESYNDDNRLKTVVVDVKDLDLITYNKKLLADIKTLTTKP